AIFCVANAGRYGMAEFCSKISLETRSRIAREHRRQRIQILSGLSGISAPACRGYPIFENLTIIAEVWRDLRQHALCFVMMAPPVQDSNSRLHELNVFCRNPLGRI